MGLVIDTDVWVLAEKSGSPLDLCRWAHYGGAYMSAITASELLVGVERANSPDRRAQRGAFVEHLLARIPVLEFSLSVGRTHARMLAALPKNLTAGAHDALIAATAVHHGYALLTRNVADFTLFAGLKVEAFV
ncbi:MAG: PIN domain-containing protein [Comamonadaceae bacterium]|nr:PIN domain-containing protein [Comamonadaceae bacterium]